MNLTEIFEKEREDYLAGLVSSLEKQRETAPDAASEVLIEIDTETIPIPYRYIRPDILLAENGTTKVIEVNKDKYFSFDPYPFTTVSGVTATLYPFHWNGLEIRFYGDIGSWTFLTDWTNKWVDIHDDLYVKGADFSGVCHGVTQPAKQDRYWETSIDLGSAGIDAIVDLLNGVSRSGANRIEMGSFSMIEHTAGYHLPPP